MCEPRHTRANRSCLRGMLGALGEGRGRASRAHLKRSALIQMAQLAERSLKSRGWPWRPSTLGAWVTDGLWGGLLIGLHRLFAVVPPGLGHAARIARFGRGSAEHVPIGEPVRGLVPVGNPIAAGADHSVKHLASRYQAVAVISRDYFVY